MILIFHFGQESFGQRENDIQCSKFAGLGDAARDLCEVVKLHFQCEGVSLKIFSRKAVDEFLGCMIKFDNDR